MRFIAISNYLRALIFAILLSFAEIAEINILAKICHLKVISEYLNMFHNDFTIKLNIIIFVYNFRHYII